MDTRIIAKAIYARANGTEFTMDDLNELLELIRELSELALDMTNGIK